MVERILGIDLGTTNLGIALIDVSKKDKTKNNILHAEVLKFEAAEVEAVRNKKWESPNKDRRLARGGRHTWDRKQNRLSKVKNLCIEHLGLQLSDLQGIESIFHRKKRAEPFEIRARAVSNGNVISAEELAQVLIHIAKSRHFAFGSKSEENLQKSDAKKKKSEEEGKEDKQEQEKLKALKAIATMGEKYELFLANGGKTIGQMIWQNPLTSNGRQIYRNRETIKEEMDKKTGKIVYKKEPIYHYNLKREWLVDEVKTIFAFQKYLGSALCTDKLLEQYLQILTWTKSQQAVGDMVGYCSILGNSNDESTRRAPKYSYSAEFFRALSKINTTRVFNASTGEVLFLRDVLDTEKIILKLREQKSISYKTIRGILPKDSSIRFFESKSRAEMTDESKEFFSLEGYHILKTVVLKASDNGVFQTIFDDKNIFNELAVVISWEKDDEEKTKKLHKLLEVKITDNNLRQKIIDELLSIGNFKGSVGFCFKVLDVIIPEMLCGDDTTTAIEKATTQGKLPTSKEPAKYDKLPPLEWIEADGVHKLLDLVITNPAVRRSVSKLRMIINALIVRYGKFDKVHIELAREINDAKTRAHIIKTQDTNEKMNENAKRLCVDCGVDPTGGYGGNLNKAKFFILQNSTPPKPKQNQTLAQLYLEQDAKSIYSNIPIKLDRLFSGEYQIDHIIPQSRGGGDNTSNLVLCTADENMNKLNQTPHEWFGKDEEKWEWFKKYVNSFKFPEDKRKTLLKTNFDENSQNEFTNRALNDTRYMARALHGYLTKYLPMNPPKHKGEIQIKVRNGRLTGTLRRFWLWEKDRDKDIHHAEDAIILAFSTDSNVKKLSDYIRSKERRERNLKFEEPMPNFRGKVKEAIALEHINEKNYKRLLVVNLPDSKVTGLAHKETFYSPKYKTVKKAGSSYAKTGVARENGGYEVMSETFAKLGVSTKRGIAVKTPPARRDIYYINGIYEVVSVSVPDIASNQKSLPTIANSGISVECSEDCFKFSLFKNNLIAIKKTKWSEHILCYFQYMNTDGRIMVKLLDGSFKETIADISKIGTIEYIKKYQIDPLGYYHEIKEEKRLGTIPQEAKRNGVNDRRAKKLAEKRAAKGK